jgi:apolipoprotein N-acyltransferase
VSDSPASAQHGGTVALWALAGALLFALAGPGPWSGWLGWLVLPALMVQYLVATASHSLKASYLLGAVYMAAFSFSLVHVAVFVWVFVLLAGGFYYLMVAVSLRRVAVPWRPWVFALAVAGASWLRANMPEIRYPHGQPCHALWQWVHLLGPVRLGGEALCNLLLAALASGLVGWTAASRARLRFGSSAKVALVVAFLAGLLFAPTPRSESVGVVDVAAVEPGFHPMDAFAGARTRMEYEAIRQRVFDERLVQPTLEVAGPAQSDAPDLVLWPESSLRQEWLADAAGELAGQQASGLPPLAEGCRLVAGGDLYAEQSGRLRPAKVVAVQFDADGKVLGHHEKRYLVPGGETIPFVGWLPGLIREPLQNALLDTFGYVPAMQPGVELPLLATGDGVPFAALVCFDNAFPEPFLAAVERGARFVVVVSNESWYRGGAEVYQLAALTVFHAVTAEVPVIRCTTDGLTVAVDRDGAVLGRLEHDPAPAAPRVLRVEVPLGAGQAPPMVWLQRSLGPLVCTLWGLLAAVGWWRARADRSAAI